jgi:signal transduction histidine kinase
MSRVSSKILMNSLVFVALLLLSALLTPQTYLMSSYKVPGKDIRFTPTTQTYLTDDYLDPELASPHGKQFLNAQQSMPRRYNFNFLENEPSAGPKSLYIPSTASNVTSLINGIPFEKSQDINLFAPGMGQAWYAQDIPRPVLTPGNNRVDLHVPSDLHRSGLRRVYLAPSEIMQKIAKQQTQWMANLPRAGILLSVISILVCGFGLLFGKHRAAFAILGAISALAFLQFLLSFFNLSAQSVFLSYLLKIGIPSSILVLLGMWARPPKRLDNALAKFSPGLTLFAAFGPAYGLLSLLIPYPMPAPLMGTTWALTSMLPLVLIWPVLNLVQDLNERRSILEALKTKISEQELLLDEKSRVIAQEMKTRAILEERQRFTRDIHDGIGGQLLALLLRVRSKKVDIDTVEAEIQAGINDLRLVVDSMDHTGDSLEMALSTFKSRTTRLLDATDISMQWHQAPILQYSMLSTTGILNLYRFMQEVISNTIRHSSASQLKVYIEDSGQLFSVKIQDDGIGLTAGDNAAGRGLGNLKQRAQLLGGSVEFTEGLDGAGLGVHLTVPYGSHSNPA